MKKTEENASVKISYFSDVLCVWAYIAQMRLAELKKKFTNQIEIIPFHITLFGDTQQRIALGWKDKGGYSGFGKHVLDVCDQFPDIEINDQVWRRCQPKTSGTAHLVLKAVQLINNGYDIAGNNYDLVKAIEWEFRQAFFRDARDISDMNVLYDIVNNHSIDRKSIDKRLNDGSAMSLFCSEMAMKEKYKLEGSPTYLLNNNRQKLYGNVGYKIMEANVAELITNRGQDLASWC